MIIHVQKITVASSVLISSFYNQTQHIYKQIVCTYRNGSFKPLKQLAQARVSHCLTVAVHVESVLVPT